MPPITRRNPNTGEEIVLADEAAIPFFPDHTETVETADPPRRTGAKTVAASEKKEQAGG